MVEFLIKRPIAVTMTFLAILVMGIVAINYIPVSLMPDIQIPEITIQVSRENASAREVEQSTVSALRSSMLTVGGLNSITSETRDESSLIKLHFDYGTDIDLAFIEVNEKIDRQMGSVITAGQPRPRVIKASATDIPAFYLEVTLKSEKPNTVLTAATEDEVLFPVPEDFVELSNFSSSVLRKRLEQLPEIALVDMSGLVFPELLIIPDMKKMEALHVSVDQLNTLIRNNNMDPVQLTIRDGQYQFDVRVSRSFNSKEDIMNLYMTHEGKLMQLKDIASVIEHPQKQRGLVSSDGKNAVTMAIIKQSDARMDVLKEQMYSLISEFQKDYPRLEFKITRDQTKLLTYSISNLTQGLLFGAVLALFSMAFFLKDLRSPLLIGFIMPASLVVSLIVFYLLGISINIISLSGLVLGVGMMVDNAIIVIDNITQYRERGKALDESCIRGASEVMVPMLSSVLTTCAVFIPLIFISGMAGALFYDEAMAVSIGSFVSLVLSVTFIPVYYRQMHKKKESSKKSWLKFFDRFNYEGVYEKGFTYIMRHQAVVWVTIITMIVAGSLLFFELPKTQIPPITNQEIMVAIDWNERINVLENKRRVLQLLNEEKDRIETYTALIAEQQFLLDERQANSSESLIYLKAKSPEDLSVIQENLNKKLTGRYAEALLSYSEAENIFRLIFSSNEAPLIAKIHPKANMGPKQNEYLQATLTELKGAIPEAEETDISWQEHVLLKIDPVKLASYNVSPAALIAKIRSSFNEQQILVITSGEEFIPVILGDNPRKIPEILSSATVWNNEGISYPIREFIHEDRDTDFKTIIADKSGEYLPVEMDVNSDRANEIMPEIRKLLNKNQLFTAEFTGGLLTNKKLMKELSIILLVSLAMLYFILATQFESLTLPLIILFEIPIDIAAAFIFLYIFGAGINLMSLIGLVVMSGIIINDSILKIDTINQLRKEGHSVLKAIATGGQRRLKPILMTSITTIVAMIPLLFIPGLGAELQKPLAIVLIGGMGVGTLVSLYFIPLCYYYLSKMGKA